MSERRSGHSKLYGKPLDENGAIELRSERERIEPELTDAEKLEAELLRAKMLKVVHDHTLKQNDQLRLALQESQQSMIDMEREILNSFPAESEVVFGNFPEQTVKLAVKYLKESQQKVKELEARILELEANGGTFRVG